MEWNSTKRSDFQWNGIQRISNLDPRLRFKGTVKFKNIHCGYRDQALRLWESNLGLWESNLGLRESNLGLGVSNPQVPSF